MKTFNFTSHVFIFIVADIADIDKRLCGKSKSATIRLVCFLTTTGILISYLIV